MEFNKKLYEFMLQSENKIWTDNGELKFGVIIYPYELIDFMNTLNYTDFEEDGVESYLKEGYLFVSLNEIFYWNNYHIKDYLDCFDKDDVILLESEIKNFDN